MKHPHLRLVVSKPDDWQPPRQKAQAVVQAIAPVEPVFKHSHFYFAAIGAAVATVLTLTLVLCGYSVFMLIQA